MITPEEQRRALAKFTDALNEFGAESVELKVFQEKYKNEPELTTLFRTVVRIQAQLYSGRALSSEE